MTGSPAADLDTAAAVLAAVREDRPWPTPAEARKLQAAVAWAAMHSVDSLAEAATVWDHGETGMPVAGPGAPLVAEFSVTEFAAAIGLPDRGRQGLPRRGRRAPLPPQAGLVPGDQGRPARLAGPPGRPRDHAPVPGGGRVRRPPRRARRAQGPPRPARPAGRGGDRAVHARGGRTPPPPGRRRPVLHHRHEATLAAGHQHRVRGARPRRRPRPRRRRRRRRAGVEGPRLHRHPGRAPGHRRRGPRPPPAHPRPQPHPGRIAGRVTAHPMPADTATGDTDGATAGEPTGTSRRATRKPRQVVLYVHLSDAAVVPGAPLAGEFGRVENTRGPVHAEQIRQWCGNPDAEITVQPVLDLNEHIDVEAYEIRGRLREQTILTHPTCVFPWCTQPARALEPDEHDADCDHRVPYAKVQHSCSCNTAPLCRRHHRAKTHGRLVLHRAGTRDLRVDQPARLPVPARPPRHPRRDPRPAPPPAGPLHPPPGRLTPPPRHPAGPPPAGTNSACPDPTPTALDGREPTRARPSGTAPGLDRLDHPADVARADRLPGSRRAAGRGSSHLRSGCSSAASGGRRAIPSTAEDASPGTSSSESGCVLVGATVAVGDRVSKHPAVRTRGTLVESARFESHATRRALDVTRRHAYALSPAPACRGGLRLDLALQATSCTAHEARVRRPCRGPVRCGGPGQRWSPRTGSELRDVRPAALAESPEMFGSTLAKEQAFDEAGVAPTGRPPRHLPGFPRRRRCRHGWRVRVRRWVVRHRACGLPWSRGAQVSSRLSSSLRVGGAGRGGDHGRARGDGGQPPRSARVPPPRLPLHEHEGTRARWPRRAVHDQDAAVVATVQLTLAYGSRLSRSSAYVFSHLEPTLAAELRSGLIQADADPSDRGGSSG